MINSINYSEISFNGKIYCKEDLELLTLKQVEQMMLESAARNEYVLMDIFIDLANSKREDLLYEEINKPIQLKLEL